MLQLSKSQEHRRSKSLGSTSPDSNGSASSSFRGFALAGSSDEDLSIPSLEVAKPGSLAVTSGSSSPSDMSWRLHYHIGLAIRALNEEIDKEATRSSDATILSVLVFLMAEVSSISVSPKQKMFSSISRAPCFRAIASDFFAAPAIHLSALAPSR